MHARIYALIRTLAIFLCMATFAAAASKKDLTLKIVNKAGLPIEFLWMNTFDGSNDLHSIFPLIRNDTSLDIDTHEGHTFMCRFKDHIVGIEKTFVKNKKLEERIIVTFEAHTGFVFKRMKAKKHVSRYAELTDKIEVSAETCSGFRGESFVQCVADGVFEEVNQVSDSKDRLSKYQTSMAARLRNYTCEDSSLESTEAISSHSFTASDGKELTIDVLLHTSHAKIWKVDNFISDDECEVLMKHAGPKLERATVAGTGGESVVSESRKAQQAGYSLHQRNPDDPLLHLHDRVLSVTNHHAKFNLESPGQEDFTIIQYNPTDQYTPHCDGGCDGDPHYPGGRVATAVMYCKVADLGGGTTFTKSDIFVKPEKGTATFFSYKGPDGKMDEGLTEHSGCPVIEGEKWIATFWMREGVSKANPWTLYDPRGKRYMADED
jgi:hypothetical protein